MKDIKALSGIGDTRAKLFEKKGIKTVEDLLYYFPRSHEDRTKFTQIADCAVGDTVCIKAKVFSPVKETRIRKNFTIYTMVVFDDSGAMNIVWYNNRFVKNAFSTDEEILFFGQISKGRKKKELLNPVYEHIGKQRFIGKIVPVYSLTEGLSQNIIRTSMEQALKDFGSIEEYLPYSIRQKYNIAEINFAMSNIHFPKDFECYEIARKRFIFEELFILQMSLLSRKLNNLSNNRMPFENVACCSDIINTLPFKLTKAQNRVISEICSDFSKATAMNRLVQGDVGSGKTIVAAVCAYVAYKNGYQTAIMAPTEILATQHYESFVDFFKNTNVNLVLLTGGTKDKKSAYEQIENGDADIIIGTNAIIQDKVKYSNLGFVVADEQHRFGVAQRAALAGKGLNPHTLIMTATPIPRTLSLILYGDLDISIIDEVPPGRKSVMTYAVGNDMHKRVYDFLDKHIKEGSQGYVVCPLVEETEKSDLANAVGIFENLSRVFPNYNVGLIHGKMKPGEKDDIMRKFAENKLQILVSTTVIEVGVNVPNSNIMIIENAERFGLSTLHQLRGRVGRGKEQAFCIMFCSMNSEITKKRMETLCKSNDGFYISEQDLKLRGPGDFFGTRQHGLPDMHIANLFSDTKILEMSQQAAKEILNGNCDMTEKEEFLLKQKSENFLKDSIVFN